MKLKHTNVTLGAYGKDSRKVLGVGATLLELDLCVMLNRVGVGEHPAAPNDEAAAAGAVLALPLPRQGEVGLRVDAEHLHHGVHRRHHLHHLVPPQGLHRRRGNLNHHLAVGRARLGPAPRPRRRRGRGGGIDLGGRGPVADAAGLAAPAAGSWGG